MKPLQQILSAVSFLILTTGLASCKEKAAVTLPDLKWPPVLGEIYPNLKLYNQDGILISLSSFKGKVVLIEPVGMTCPACHAFSGAAKKGGYLGVRPQPGLPDIYELIEQYAPDTQVPGKEIVFVQLILYDESMGAPSQEDIESWAKHFGLQTADNVHVLAGTPEMIGEASYNLIPGFQLIGKDFVLRADSTGHRPRDDLYTKLLPMIPRLIEQSAMIEVHSMDSPEVAAAYRAIPHRQTSYSGKRSPLQTDVASELAAFFALTDTAVVLRVSGLQDALKNGPTEIAKTSAAQRKLAEVIEMKYSGRPAFRLVAQAVKEQAEFFEQWASSPGFPENYPQILRNHPLVQSSSAKLRKAYNILMQEHANESAHNKQAFFDHLCSLDFV